jgi:hypothetical protein
MNSTFLIVDRHQSESGECLLPFPPGKGTVAESACWFAPTFIPTIPSALFRLVFGLRRLHQLQKFMHN